jgi:hypothetical protein
MTTKKTDWSCKALTKNGQSCRAAATAGGLCFFHANPNKASELGRLGGKSNRHVGSQSVEPLPPLEDAVAVRDAVARVIADVHAGRTHPRAAFSLARLLNLHLRAIEAVAKAEEQRRAATASPATGIAERLKRARERMQRFANEELLDRSSALSRISTSSQPID